MNISYRTVNIIALAVLLPITSFAMMPQSICDVLPREINKTAFNHLNLYNQDQLRATCVYWKKIGDERSSYLLDLLHSPSNTTTQTKVRILFDAVHNNNYDLAEHMLKITPEHHLKHPTYTNTLIDLYTVAQKNNDENMLNLMEQYEGLRRQDSLAKYIEHPVVLDLLISCISGDNDSVKKIMSVEFKTDEVCCKIKNNKNKYNRPTGFIIQYALDFAVSYDDDACILAWQGFFKDNPEMDWLIDRSLSDACKFKNKKAFKALLQQYNDVNKIMNGSFNSVATLITIKNEFLGGTVWNALDVFTGDEQYRNEIEAIFNECGAKTYEELQAENSSPAQDICTPF